MASLYYTSLRLQPFPLPSGWVPAERQLVSCRQSAPKHLSTVLAGPGGQ